MYIALHRILTGCYDHSVRIWTTKGTQVGMILFEPSIHVCTPDQTVMSHLFRGGGL